MDGSNWKRILLHWANQTNLLEKFYYNIEQTDIDVFYEKFRCRMSTTPIVENDLILFLKEKYPNFEVHLDDGGNITSSDYMYVYSLLLHYSCVKCPESFFHEACQSLPEQFQQAIASFFQMLMDKERLDREVLRHAIHTSSPKSPLRFVPIESPIRTPRNKISPPTPKTSMLEERTKELNLLKAQLESERYEKGFIEIQLKQNEEKIRKLTQEQKSNLAEIYTLKNELLAKNTENNSPSKNSEEEQIKRRLRKSIAEKEETILNLRENLEGLGEEKKSLFNKLAYAENQVGICLDKIKEMDYIINELKSEIEKRDLTIQTLTETKNELELFITESRSSSQGFRHELNNSIECLDVSLSRTTNSSGSIISSPENLGVSVVDVKLREKENENLLLCERIEEMKNDCEKLSKHVYDLIVRYSDTFDICNENLVLTDDANLTYTFMVFENYVEKIVESYQASNKNLKAVSDENVEIQSQNAIMVKRITELEDQLTVCRKQIESLVSEKDKLEAKNTYYSTQSMKYQDEIRDLTEQHLNVQSRFNELNSEYEASKETQSEKMYQLTADNFKIESQLNVVLTDMKRLSDDRDKAEAEIRCFEVKVAQMTEDLKDSAKKIDDFETSNGNLLLAVATHIEQIRENENKISELEKTIEKLELAIEMLNQEKNVLLEEKNTMQSSLETTKNDLIALQCEYKVQLDVATERESEIDRLKESLAKVVDELQLKITSNEESKMKLIDSSEAILKYKEMISGLIQRRDELEATCRNLTENVTEMEATIVEKVDYIANVDSAFQKYKETMENELESIDNELKNQISKYEGKLRDLTEEINKLNDDKYKLEQRDLEKAEEVDRLNLEVIDLQEQKKLIEQQLNDENKSLEQQNDLILTQSKKIENELISLLKTLCNQDSCVGDGLCVENNSNSIDYSIKCLKERTTSLLKMNEELSQSGLQLKSVVSDLKNQITDLRQTSEEMDQRNQTLAEEIAQSECRARSLEQENEFIVKKIEELNKKLSEEQQARIVVDQRSAECESMNANLQDTIEKLISERNALLEDISLIRVLEIDLTENLAKLKSEIAERTENEQSLKEKLIISEMSLSKMREECSLLQKELSDKETVLENLGADRRKLNTELEQLSESTSARAEKINDLQKENIILVNQFKQLEDELASLKSRNESLQTDLEEKEVDLDLAKEEITKLNDSIAVMQAQQKSLEEATVDRETKIKQLDGFIIENNTEIGNLKNKLSTLEQTIKEKDATIDEWRLLLQTADTESKTLCEKYKETLESLESRINDLDKEKEALECANKCLEDNLIQMEDSMIQTQSVNVELLNQIDELKSSQTETTQRETDYINLQLRYVSLNNEKDQLLSSKQKLEENCNKLSQRVEKLSVKLGELQANAAKLDKLNSGSRSEIENLQKIFQQNRLQLEDVRNKLEVSQLELKAANDEVSKIRKEYNAELTKNVTLTKELQKLSSRVETESPKLQRELKVANERSSNLQKLYNEEVAKTVTLNCEIQVLHSQLEKKAAEVQDQCSFLTEIKSDLECKIDTLNQMNCDVAEFKAKNEKLEDENKNLSEKIVNLLSIQGKLKQAETVLEDLEQKNTALQARLNEYSTTEENFKETTSHIDNIKHELELKVEKLSESLEQMSASLEYAKSENNYLQRANVQLKHTFDCLAELVPCAQLKTESDSEVSVVKDNLDGEYVKLVESVKNLGISHQNFADENIKLVNDLEACREENSELSDKLSKLSIKLQILEKQNNELSNEVADLQTAYDSLRVDKQNLETENQTAQSTIETLEARQNEILHEHLVAQDALNERLEHYKIQIVEKMNTIQTLKEQLNDTLNVDAAKSREFSLQTEQFDKLQEKFQTLEQQIKGEREHNEKLKKDISIFQAKLFKNRQLTEEKEKKWKEERNKLNEEVKLAENRIKDNRLELEGKLEKMKNKMKTLYNDEVTKIKNKHDRELSDCKGKMDALLMKNEKYEAHVQKLAKQVFNLNEEILELQKQNKFMETRLKDMESLPSSSLRRQSHFASQMIGSNLRMEDEEGELFNNTYLADLKTGRMSPFGRDSVSISELHYRNSLAPPHLRSTYIAQYPDHYLREEDIKDVPINLDDSLSSLLHAGQRKKMSGTTSYKKPGPPTPSKNGGRLSFGGTGSNDPPREILKECNDISVMNSKKTATPSKFRNMFSSSRMKDELLTLLLERNTIQRKRRKSITRPLNLHHFTSTPRKSRIYFDQRKHLGQLVAAENRDSDNVFDYATTKSDIKPLSLVPKKDMVVEKFTKWRQSKLPSTDSCTTSDSNSPCVAERDDGFFVKTVQKVSMHKGKDRRSSFVLRGNMFARRKIGNSSLVRDNLRDKAKQQRSLHFNKYRKSLCNENLIMLRKSILDRLSSIDPPSTVGMESIDDQETNSHLVLRPTRDSIEKYPLGGDVQMFERLLKLKESNAPFEVSDISLTSTSLSQQTSLKTLYSGSVIKNRKIPHVNTTVVENTSSSSKGRKITVLHIIRNWHKLDLFVKSILIVSLAVLVFNILFGIHIPK